MNNNIIKDIDLVFTWVQPDDMKCALERKMHQAMTSLTMEKRRLPPSEIDHTKTELFFALRLALKNLPWVRKIFILVHDNQVFRGIDFCEKKDKIQIVYHSDIFPNPIIELPTFNSHAIETCIHNIPGLAEHFIYFNDDCYVIEPIESPMFFFKKENEPYFFHDGITKRWFLHEKLPTNFATHYICCIQNHKLLDNTFGFQQIRQKPWHQPLPFTKTLIGQAESFFSSNWQQTRESKFRSIHNIVPLYLALELALVRKQISMAPWYHSASSISMWRSCPSKMHDWEILKLCIQNRKTTSSFSFSFTAKFSKKAILFFCLNDMSDDTPISIRQNVFLFLNRLIES